MAVAASRVVVADTATKIAENTTAPSGQDDAQTVAYLLKNATATESVFLGASGVTTAAGFEWATTDGALVVSLEPGESLYGIVATDDQTVHGLKVGRSG